MCTLGKFNWLKSVLAMSLAAIVVISGVVIGGGGISGSGRGSMQRERSVVLNDFEFFTEEAQIFVNGVGAVQGDLKPGQVLEIIGDFDTGIAEVVSYRSDIIGPIDKILVDLGQQGVANLQVLGQQVNISIRTNVADTALEDLTVGTMVELSGLWNVNDVLEASFARKVEGSQYRLIGFIDFITPEGFSINDLDVDTSQAAMIGFNPLPVAGQRVEVIRDITLSLPPILPTVNEAITDVTNGVFPSLSLEPQALVASSVEYRPPTPLQVGQVIEIEDLVSEVINAETFSLGGWLVRTNENTRLRSETPPLRTVGSKIEVEGIVDVNGTIVAESIIAKHFNAVRAEGLVTAVNTDPIERTVTILGLPFKVDTSTDFSLYGYNRITSLEEIQVGDYMRVDGFADGQFVVASRILQEELDEDARLVAPVSEIDVATASLSLCGVPIVTDSAVTKFSINDVIVDEAEFFEALEIGVFVKARWDNFSAISEPPDELEIE